MARSRPTTQSGSRNRSRSGPPTARRRAVDAIERQARRFPDLLADEPAGEDLSAADRALAGAIYHTTIQRWLTLEHLLGQFVRGKWSKLEPRLRAILLTAGTQVLFMDGVPAYAAVDEAVSLARRDLREGAAKMANAVLRRLVSAIDEPHAAEPWQPDAALIPLDAEHVIRLNAPLLPDPADRLNHLAAALSHPTRLLATWLKQFDIRRTKRIALHGLQTPPWIVHVGDTLSEDAGAEALFTPHEDDARFVVWRGTHEQLRTFLDASPPHRWVQDPAAALPVDQLRDTAGGDPPETILDYCAGAGTKTRQLAAAFPESRIYATDPDDGRFALLHDVAAHHANVQPVPFAQVHDPTGPLPGPVDALLLDVPCSNTGVLARRGEARYRYSRKHLEQLVTLQQRILTEAAPLLREPGLLVYSTCSVDRAENQQQTRRAAERLNRHRIVETGDLPRGETDTTWHDGAYVAILAPAAG